MTLKRFKEKHHQNSGSSSLYQSITDPMFSKISPSLDFPISKTKLTKFKIETQSENKDKLEISKKTQQGQI